MKKLLLFPIALLILTSVFAQELPKLKKDIQDVLSIEDEVTSLTCEDGVYEVKYDVCLFGNPIRSCPALDNVGPSPGRAKRPPMPRRPAAPQGSA